MHGDFDGFTKNLVLSVLFFVATPIIIFSFLFSLISLSRIDQNPSNPEAKSRVALNSDSVKVLSALPPYSISTNSSVGVSDARYEIIRKYLNFYRSPLEPFSNFIIQTSDKYGLDYRLLTAIAQQESNLCKSIPDGTHNCWGWGIHSKGVLGFSTYEEAIDTVAKGLKENYIDKGYNSPEEIMAKYTPQSSGSWANGVNHFMEDIESTVK